MPTSDEALARWDELADGLESGGVEGFLEAYERQGLHAGWRDTLLRITRERLFTHRHPEAVARALREVPRDVPFDVARRARVPRPPGAGGREQRRGGPGAPASVAEAYAARLPDATLVAEGEGESPLAWQGGKLAREIVRFCERPQVAERLSG